MCVRTSSIPVTLSRWAGMFNFQDLIIKFKIAVLTRLWWLHRLLLILGMFCPSRCLILYMNNEIIIVVIYF